MQDEELGVLVQNFPPKSLPAIILVRDTLFSYAETYPVRSADLWGAGHLTH